MKKGIIITILLMFSLLAPAQIGTVTKYISYGSYSNLLGQTVESNVFDMVNFGGVITNLNLNVSTNVVMIQNTVTNLTIQNITTNTTNTYTAVDDSKWSTNQPFISSLIWTNSGANSTVTNGGMITATINTNSGTGSGGVTNHNQLSGVVGNGSNHLSAAEVARIPPDYTNVTIQGSYRHNGTNGFWAPVYERYDTGLSTVWTHATNLYSSGISTQRWIVPAGVEQVYLSAWGAGGGGAANGLGGDGGFAHTVVNVTAGDTVSVAVATSGQGFGSTNINTLGGWPGGGNGGGGTNVTTRGGGGGGCSVVWHNSTIVAVAAGGGGGNPINASSPGGAGGGLVGGSGAGSTGTLPTGGNQNGGGSGGLGLTYLGANGTFLSGGSGTSVVATVTGSSGGGGSGYYGGGGGSYQSSAGQSGGGGSCWVAPTDLYGYICRGKNADDPDYVVPWGAGGSTSASGADGGVVLKWFYVIP